MKLLQLHIPEDFHKELKQEALNQNMSLKDLVISALEPILKTKHPKTAPAVIELTKLANDPVSKTVEDVVEDIENQEVAKSAMKGDLSWCKNGHPIPSGKSRCMGKGCKYS